jgi:hypothetical protein
MSASEVEVEEWIGATDEVNCRRNDAISGDGLAGKREG